MAYSFQKIEYPLCLNYVVSSFLMTMHLTILQMAKSSITKKSRNWVTFSHHVYLFGSGLRPNDAHG